MMDVELLPASEVDLEDGEVSKKILNVLRRIFMHCDIKYFNLICKGHSPFFIQIKKYFSFLIHQRKCIPHFKGQLY